MSDFIAIDPDARPLGRNGLAASRLGWGMWRLRRGASGDSRRLAECALEAGLRLFDTADVYGMDDGGFGSAEAEFGAVLKEAPRLRDQIVLATKGGVAPGTPYNSSGDYLVRACEASLRRLGVDCIDLYQIHRPDHLAHPAEIASAFAKLRTDGKIKEAGVSNFSAAQTAALRAHMPFPLASIQPEFSALAIDALSDGVLDQAMERDLAVLAWSPLAQGRLGGAGEDARSVRVAQALDVIAAREGVSRTAVALAWVLAHPARPTALIGSQSPERIAASAEALKVRMTRAEWYAVLVASRGARMP